jgi:4-amino-4-deoxy-L-arabinose transferase-like glycosyltransferase
MKQKKSSPPKKTSYFRWFWLLIILCMVLRLGLSLYLMADNNYFFTLSADDVARYRIAILWSEDASFFPDPTWPPFPFWLGGLMIKIFASGHATLSILSIIASILSIPLLGLLCWGLIPQTGPSWRFRTMLPLFVPLAIFVFYPQWIWLGSSMLAESLYTFLFLLSFIAFILAIDRRSILLAFSALVIAILASMTRLEGIALVGIIYLLMVWRLRRHPKTLQWVCFIIIGGALTLAFPLTWMMAHTGDQGTISYFAALNHGFSSQYSHSPFWTPIHFLRIYIGVSPLYLFIIIVDISAAWHERRKNHGIHDLIGYQIMLTALYVLAQISASALGMMPTHNFWRLTFPIFVTLLPYIGVTFAMIGQFVPARLLVLPAALCIFYLIPSFTKPPAFVSSDLYQSAIDLKSEIKHHRYSNGKTLIEVNGWEWLTLAVIGQGSDLGELLYDRDPHKRDNAALNPPVFRRPAAQLKKYIADKNVEIIVVKTFEAKQTMMQLGWKAVKSSRYAIFIKP